MRSLGRARLGLILLVLGLGLIMAFPGPRHQILSEAEVLLGSKGRLERLHEATRISSSPLTSSYSFTYSADNVDLIRRDSKRCRRCHGSMLQTKDGEPVYPIHTKMLTAELLDLDCTICHKKVDLQERSSQSPTIRVDRNLCTKCHESALSSAPAGQGESVQWNRGEIPDRYLIGNHGSTPDTAARWLTLHGRAAKSSGEERCRQCHQPGSELDFCGTCHETLRGSRDD